MSNARILSSLIPLGPVLAALVTIGQQGAEQPGIIKDFAGPEANIPEGYLPCYGQELSRATYAALFAAIGTTWGPGNGTTTFNAPDLRGRGTAGADGMGGVAAGRLSLGSVGASGGVESVTLTAAQSGMPAHGHTASTGSAGAHTHTVPGSDPVQGNNGGVSLDANAGAGSIGTSSAGAHTHTVTVNNASAVNASQAHTNVQPTAVVIKIIKT